MKKTILSLSLMAAAIPAVTLAAPSTAHAGDCGSVASVTEDLWDKWGSLASSIPYLDKVDQMISFWNSMAGNSWAKIGPRRLEYGTTQTGSVVGPTDRVFIAESPTDASEVKIRLEKVDGKAETTITVCKVSKSGTKTKLWDFTADNGNYTKVWTKDLSGVKDHIVTVHLHGHSATNKFQYKLRATK